MASSDAQWRHFLKDFRTKLIETGTYVYITAYDERVFRYRLKDYLLKISVPPDLSWIIIWLNNLETELNFVGVEKLVIPNYQEVARIRKLFDASRLD